MTQMIKKISGLSISTLLGMRFVLGVDSGIKLNHLLLIPCCHLRLSHIQ
jgi:hypothetical protein